MLPAARSVSRWGRWNPLYGRMVKRNVERRLVAALKALIAREGGEVTIPLSELVEADLHRGESVYCDADAGGFRFYLIEGEPPKRPRVIWRRS